MKKLALSAISTIALSVTALAGHEVVDKNYKQPVPTTPCFADHELQLDTFAVFNNYKGDNGFGGGLGLNYFFTKNIGLGIDASWSNIDGDDAWIFSGSILARWPIESGSFCWAPYIKGTGGLTDRETKAGFLGVGGGVEFRFNPHWAFYGEGTYNWACADEDFAQARAGFRWIF